MVDQTTGYLQLALPHPDNALHEDCPRLRQALTALDSHAQTTDEALAAQTAALAAETAAREQADTQQAETLAAETSAREQGDAGQADALAALAATVAALQEKMDALDPWTIFPLRVPIGVDGVRFPEGENARHPIMPGETEPRLNWVICDGGDDGQGGTVPDLRGRMILGASEARPAGSTGGSETHQHSVSGTLGETTLSVAQMPAHTHTAANGANGNLVWGGGNNAFRPLAATGSTGGSQSHTHSLTGSSGESGSLPPYYALTYIMRCA